MDRVRLRRLAAAALFVTAGPAAARPPPVVWHAPVEIATGAGVRGPWQQNDSLYDYVDDPTVAVDERGNIAVAWADQSRKDVLLRRLPTDGAGGSGTTVDVSRSPATFSWLPRIAFAPDAPDVIHVIWQEIIFSGGSHGGDILYARSDDAGRTFGPALNLSASVGGDGKGRITREVWHNGSLDLVAGPQGRVLVAWTEYDGPLWFSRSTDGGRTFGRPRPLAGDATRPARGPSLAIGPSESVYLAWTVGEQRDADIRLARSVDGGQTFAAPAIVAASDGYSDAPKVAIDGNGTVHVAYAESRGGPFDRYAIRYTRSHDAGRTFEPARQLSRTSAAAAFPYLATDKAGRIVVIWEQFPDTRPRPRGLGISVSTDGGASFTAPESVPVSDDAAGGANGSAQGLLMQKLAVNGRGDLAIVNSSLLDGRHSRVWLIRGTLAPGPTNAATPDTVPASPALANGADLAQSRRTSMCKQGTDAGWR